MIEFTMNRHNHGIDPLHFWGWEIPVYLFLGGLAAGIMIFAAIMAMRAEKLDDRSPWLRWSPFIAPVAISIGMGALFLDLAHKLFVWRFYLAFQVGSPMSWGSWLLLVVYPAVILLGLAGITDADCAKLQSFGPIKKIANLGIMRALKTLERGTALRHWTQANIRPIAWTNIILGVGLGAYTGVLLSGLGARPMWSSGILPVLFLCSGLSAGAALMMLLPITHTEHETLRRWDMIIIVVEVAVLVLYVVNLLSGSGLVGKEAAAHFLGGHYTAPFWGFVVFLGLLVPFTMEYIEGVRKLKPAVAAPALLLVGSFALRWILVYGGQL